MIKPYYLHKPYLSADGYRVPRQLSVSSIMALVTVLALLFGILRWVNAPPAVDVLIGTQAVLVCLAQMRFATMARAVSAAVGAICLPLWVIAVTWLRLPVIDVDLQGALSGLPFEIAIGAVLGYCTGAIAAGIFLVMDRVEEMSRARRPDLG